MGRLTCRSGAACHTLSPFILGPCRVEVFSADGKPPALFLRAPEAKKKKKRG